MLSSVFKNTAYLTALSQLIIQPIICCTCPYFLWCINLITRILKKKKKTHTQKRTQKKTTKKKQQQQQQSKQFGQSSYKLLLRGTHCFGAGCVDLGVTDERECPMIHAKYYVHRPSGSSVFFLSFIWTSKHDARTCRI